MTAAGTMAVVVLAAGASGQDRFLGPRPGEQAFTVQRDLPYRQAGDRTLAFDLYRPAVGGARPVVVFLNGIGVDWMRGHAQYAGWAAAVTTRGLAGITMDSNEPTVDDDFRSLVAHLRANAAILGVDPGRLLLWSCSANVKRGLPLAMAGDSGVQAAVVYYGIGELTAFRGERPVLFVRAGLDNPGLNRALDELVARGLRDNAPVEVLNYAAGSHGFDLRDDTETTRAVITRTLDFMERALTTPLVDAVRDGVPLAAAAGRVFQQDWKGAADAYAALAAARPADSLVWQRLGEARVALGEWRPAAEAFEKALALGSPNRGMVSVSLAKAYARLGDADRALAALEGVRQFLRFFVADLKSDPAFASLRTDPRFAALVPAQ
jgi:hypothetical protein